MNKINECVFCIINNLLPVIKRSFVVLHGYPIALVLCWMLFVVLFEHSQVIELVCIPSILKKGKKSIGDW